MVPLTAQVDLSSMEIVGLIRYTQRILMRRHPNEFSKLSMFWKAEDMPLNRYSGSMYQKRLRDGVMIASSRGCGIGTHRGKNGKTHLFGQIIICFGKRHPGSNQIPFDIRATFNVLPFAAIAMDFDK